MKKTVIAQLVVLAMVALLIGTLFMPYICPVKDEGLSLVELMPVLGLFSIIPLSALAVGILMMVVFAVLRKPKLVEWGATVGIIALAIHGYIWNELFADPERYSMGAGFYLSYIAMAGALGGAVWMKWLKEKAEPKEEIIKQAQSVLSGFKPKQDE